MAQLAKMPPIEEHLHACTMCGYCVPVCPPYQEAGWESASPRGRVYAMRQYDLRGPLDRLLRRHVTPGEEFAKSAWECTGCGACEEVCPVDIPFNTLWDDVKSWMVESGYPRKPLEPYLLNVKESHNIYGKDPAARKAWMPADARESDMPEVVFWVGCVASYEKQQIAKAVIKILNAARVTYRILGPDEWCSGAPLTRMGYRRVVEKEIMPHNLEAVARTGAKALVTACAECYRAFARDYREWAGNPPFSVYHISHFVEKLVSEKRIAFTKSVPEKIAFHDACHMGRVCDTYDAPRQALKFVKDLKILEMVPTREETLCSGGGGGFPDVFPDQAANVGSRRIEDAVETGATRLVTTCPHAECHFDKVAAQRNMKMSIVDLAEMIAQAL